jgi:hypothetical protein
VWAAIVALLYRAFKGSSTRALIVLAVVVLSHWLLDVITHRPDIPLMPADDTRIGLICGLATADDGGRGTDVRDRVWLYVSTTARERIGSGVGPVGLVAFLTIAYLRISSVPFRPARWPSPRRRSDVAARGWGYWIDRHRELRIRT